MTHQREHQNPDSAELLRCSPAPPPPPNNKHTRLQTNTPTNQSTDQPTDQQTLALQQEGREQPGVYSRNFCVRTSRLKLKIYHPNTENETTNQEPSLVRKLHQHGGEPVSQHPPKPSKKRMGEGGRGEARAPWFPSFSSSSWWSCDCGTFWGRHLGALSCVRSLGWPDVPHPVRLLP